MKLLKVILRVNLLTELAYRTNLWIQVSESGAHFLLSILGVLLVFSHTQSLNGWNQHELIALVGVFFWIGGMIGFLIRPSLERFMQDIHKGTLDFILLKPVDAQLMISIQRLEIWKLIDVVLGGSLIVYAMYQLNQGLEPWHLLYFGLAMGTGFLIVYAFWIILATLAFWLVRVDNLLVIFESMYEAGRWPVTIYPGWLRMILTFIIPIAFATTVPAQALVGRLNPSVLIGAGILGVGLLIVARVFWKFGIKHYTGASA